MEPASDGSAAKHRSEMKRVNLVLNEALYRDLERSCEECHTGSDRGVPQGIRARRRSNWPTLSARL